jgi:hypothetical protein
MNFADRIKDSTTSTGTGPIVLSGTPPIGFAAFGDVYGWDDPVPYCIADQSGPNWEIGVGTFDGATGLTRTTVLSSSLGGLPVAFTAGMKDVFVTVPASVLSALTSPLTNGSYLPVLLLASSGNAFYRYTITGNMTLAEPSFGQDGHRIKLWVVASGADRVLTLNSLIKIPSSSAFTSPVTILSGKKAKLLLEYDASLNGGQWELTSFINGY